MKKKLFLSRGPAALVFSVVLLLTGMSNALTAQEDKGKFLLRDSKVKLSTFYAEVAPSTSFTFLNDQMTSIMELTGGLILNQRFYFGYFMTGASKVNTVPIPEPLSDEWFDWLEAGVELDKISSNAETLFARFKHSGLKFGYMHNTGNTIFWRTGIMFGFSGGFSMTEDQTFLGLFDNLVWESKIITLEPHVGGSVNLLPWWRANLDIGYRLVRLDENIVKATDTDGITLKLGFAFGNFRQK
jgi:hypothetical protein